MHSIDLLMFNLALLGCNIHWVRFSDSEKWVFVLFCSHLFFYLCYMHECFACMYAYAPCAHRALKAKGDTGVPGTGVTAGCELPCSTETWTSVHWKSSQESYQLSLPSSPLLMITNGRGPQILSWSWGLPGMGPGNQTPVWSSARRAGPLNCRAVSLANFLFSPFSPASLFPIPSLCCLGWRVAHGLTWPPASASGAAGNVCSTTFIMAILHVSRSSERQRDPKQHG